VQAAPQRKGAAARVDLIAPAGCGPARAPPWSRAMIGKLRVAALCALMLTAQACGKRPEADASGAVQGLLAAAQAGDAPRFEALIDRPVLRADLRGQMIAVARANGLDVGGPSDLALDRMIGPQALKLVRAGDQAPLAAPPAESQVAALLKPLDKTRVCLHDLTPQQKCLMTFAREPAGWRLVGMPAGDLTIEIAPEPAKKG
jgi:hypothetical protein